MNESFNKKIQDHVEYMLTLNQKDYIEYAFNKYYEYENDEELASFFLAQIAKVLFGVRGNNLKNILNLRHFDRKYIVDALNKYYYDEINSFRGPLNNILGELLDDGVEKPLITPYMHLIITLLFKKDETITKIF